MGAAWATLACYFSMAVISYVWGQKHYPIPYNVSRVLLYMAGAVVLWWGTSAALGLTNLGGLLEYSLRAVVLTGYVAVVWKLERGALRV
jgi:hypothetical protein